MTKKDDEYLDGGMEVLLEALITGDTNAAILGQEKRGQTDLVHNEKLPIEINGGTKEQFEEMGIVYADRDSVPEDAIFIDVTLPEGWRKEPTDHSMWSNLVDDQDRVRASIFYKAAFYDRSAHISIDHRFNYRIQPVGGYDNYKDHTTDPKEAVVTDCGKTTWTSKPMEPSNHILWTELDSLLLPLAKGWLEKNYPNWENPLAYWD